MANLDREHPRTVDDADPRPTLDAFTRADPHVAAWVAWCFVVLRAVVLQLRAERSEGGLR